MPIYEYKCADCTRLTSVFVRSVSSTIPDVKCDHCGSTNTARAISSFGIGRTMQQVLDQYGDPGHDGLDDHTPYKDPRQIGRWAEEQFSQYGMELPDDVRGIIDAAREGEYPAPMDEDD